MRPHALLPAALCLALLCSGCATAPAAEAPGAAAPGFMEQVRTHYRENVPAAVRVPVRNAIENIAYTDVFANNLLQGKLGRAHTDLQRIVVNTLALGGALDVATNLGIPKYEEDFGQTLGVWGLGHGIYADLPVVGPLTLRDSFKYPFAYLTSPFTVLQWTTDIPRLVAWGGRSAVFAVRELEKRDALGLTAQERASPAARKAAYLARRERLVRDEPERSYPRWTTPPPPHLRHLRPPQVIRRTRP